MNVGEIMLTRLVLCLIACLVACSAVAAPQRGTGERIKVGTRIVPPFVMQDGDRLTGFSVDLWNELAERTGIETEFELHGPLPELLDAVKTGRDALAVGAISITAAREADFDFSQPMFDDGGLGILVSDAGSPTLLDVFGTIGDAKVLKVIGLLSLLIIVVAHVVWFVERDGHFGIAVDRRYIPGVFEAAFWSATVLGGQGHGVPGKWISRIVNMISIYIGLVLGAQFTATITTSVIVGAIHGEVSGPGDLPGKRVATVRGSTATNYLRLVGAVPIEFDSVDQALDAVRDRHAVAAVYDAPVLLYYLTQDGRQSFRMAGPPFRHEGYGILLPLNSPYRKRIDQALLELRESCSYQRLYQKWFGHAIACVPNPGAMRYAKDE
jgi:polar amino acid transport system substrate-binding protein